MVLRPRGEMPALTWGAWRKDELPIAVYAAKLKGFRAATSGTIQLVTMGLNAGELVFGKKIITPCKWRRAPADVHRRATRA